MTSNSEKAFQTDTGCPENDIGHCAISLRKCLASIINGGSLEIMQDLREIQRLLNILNDYTSDEARGRLPQEVDIFNDLVKALKHIHFLDKNSQPTATVGGDDRGREDLASASSARVRLDDLMLKNSFKEDFCIKKNLVRLIANLSYRNEPVKRAASTNDCIPLVCDLCHFCPKNPFIREWCIFALRNLLENNQTNQDILASITRQGTSSDYSLLGYLGLRMDNNSLVE